MMAPLVIRNLLNRSRIGLVIDWSFHQRNNWVSAFTPALVKQIIQEFDPIIIRNQAEYELYKKRLDSIIMMEPGWGAPKLKLDKKRDHYVAVMLSDPHSKVSWFEDFFEANNIDCVLSQYRTPFFFHFPHFPIEKFQHFPWAVDDRYLDDEPPNKKAALKVGIFGGKASDAYDVRNWCREQKDVYNFSNSGVENKVFSDQGYFKFLNETAAWIAAGSSKPEFQMVTPKYFEIASSGSLLFAQKCPDLTTLGFNDENCILFDVADFQEKVSCYTRNPTDYYDVRSRGKQLIRDRHTVSQRIGLLSDILKHA